MVSMHKGRHRFWRLLLVRFLGRWTHFRVLWVVTLALVVREVYLEHSGNVSRGPPAGGIEAMKDGPVPMESHNNGTPMSNPNL